VDQATGRSVVDLCSSCAAAVAAFIATRPRASSRWPAARFAR
jgi:hypothetical protein